MNQEQIDKECDAIVEKFYKVLSSYYAENQIAQEIARSLLMEDSLQCAILYQTGIVDTLRKLKLPFNNAELTDAYAVVDCRLDIAQQILETLKSRVK